MKNNAIAKLDGDRAVVPVEDYIEGFRKNLAMGVAAIKEAARNYAEALRRHPTTAPERFEREFPGVSAESWEMLERIGNGDLNENAFFLPYATAKKLMHIPVERQKRIFDKAAKGFEVVSPMTGKTRVVPLQALSPSQASLLIDMEGGKVRSVEEQRERIREMNEQSVAGAQAGNRVRYRIVGNVCIINGVEVGRETLKNILAEMDARAAR